MGITFLIKRGDLNHLIKNLNSIPLSFFTLTISYCTFAAKASKISIRRPFYYFTDVGPIYWNSKLSL